MLHEKNVTSALLHTSTVWIPYFEGRCADPRPRSEGQGPGDHHREGQAGSPRAKLLTNTTSSPKMNFFWWIDEWIRQKIDEFWQRLRQNFDKNSRIFVRFRKLGSREECGICKSRREIPIPTRSRKSMFLFFFEKDRTYLLACLRRYSRERTVQTLRSKNRRSEKSCLKEMPILLLLLS